MTEYQLAVQAVGLVGCIIGMAGTLSLCDRRLKYVMGLAGAIMAAHFYLLEVYTAAIAASLSSCRFFLATFPWFRRFVPLYMSFYLLLGVTTYVDWISFLAMMGGMLGTLAVGYYGGIRMRMTLVAASLSWLSHNILRESWGGVVLESFFLCFNGYTVWRLYKLQNKTSED